MSAAPVDRERLSRLLGMMGSDFDGEALNAARQAEKLRREAGLTWAQILAPPSPAAAPQPVAPSAGKIDITTAIQLCIENERHLSAWERGFLVSVQRQLDHLSDKQIACLDGLARKITAIKSPAARAHPKPRRGRRHKRRKPAA